MEKATEATPPRKPITGTRTWQQLTILSEMQPFSWGTISITKLYETLAICSSCKILQWMEEAQNLKTTQDNQQPQECQAGS